MRAGGGGGVMISDLHSKFIKPTVNSSETALLESITGKRLTTTVFKKKTPVDAHQ